MESAEFTSVSPATTSDTTALMEPRKERTKRRLRRFKSGKSPAATGNTAPTAGNGKEPGSDRFVVLLNATSPRLLLLMGSEHLSLWLGLCAGLQDTVSRYSYKKLGSKLPSFTVTPTA